MSGTTEDAGRRDAATRAGLHARWPETVADSRKNLEGPAGDGRHPPRHDDLRTEPSAKKRSPGSARGGRTTPRLEPRRPPRRRAMSKPKRRDVAASGEEAVGSPALPLAATL